MKRRRKRNCASQVHQPHEIEVHIVSPNDIANEIFCLSLLPIKYSASSVGPQGLSSTQLENDFSLGMKWTGQGCIQPSISTGRRQSERLFGSSEPSHIDKTAEHHRSQIPLLPLVYRAVR